MAERLTFEKLAGGARIRMYRQGLGDCFLLSFPADRKKLFHIVIDCGVLSSSPDGTARMRKVVDDIAAETDSTVDLLIGTHEHQDHLSGFNQAGEVWKKIKAKRVWLAWTENVNSPAVQQLKAKRALMLKAALAGVQGMRGMAANHPRLADKLNAQANAVQGLLEFSLGEDDTVEGLLGADEKKLSGPARALEFLKSKGGANLRYCHFQHPPRKLPGVADVRVFVLGPPEGTLLKHSEPRHGEAYSVRLGLSEELCFALAAFPSAFSKDIPADAAAPFDRFYKRHRDDLAHPHIVAAYEDSENEWRKIDTDWLNVSEALALVLTGHINNTSLALAFELGPNGPVLLFPADAQIGSWLSWSSLEWKFKEDGQLRKVTGRNLLERTVFYKVGHHGSHNATAKDEGLELMNDDDLVAFIPVHQKTAVGQGWKMPFKPMWRELKKRTKGRIILSDADLKDDKQPLLDAEEAETYKRDVAAFKKKLTWDKSGEDLWVEYIYRK